MEFATPRPSFKAPGEQDPNVFRTHPAVRVSGIALIAGFGLIGVCTALLALMADTKPESGLFWVTTLLVGVAAVAMHRVTLHPMVAIEATGVRVRNVFSEHLLPWDEIAGVKPGYWGLTITLRSSRPVCAFALQKSNYAVALGQQETGSDLAARRILERATGESNHPGVALPTEEEQKAAAKKARIIIGIAFSLFVVKTLVDLL